MFQAKSKSQAKNSKWWRKQELLRSQHLRSLPQSTMMRKLTFGQQEQFFTWCLVANSLSTMLKLQDWCSRSQVRTQICQVVSKMWVEMHCPWFVECLLKIHFIDPLQKRVWGVTGLLDRALSSNVQLLLLATLNQKVAPSDQQFSEAVSSTVHQKDLPSVRAWRSRAVLILSNKCQYKN